MLTRPCCHCHCVALHSVRCSAQAWGYTDEFSDNGTVGYDARDGDFPRHTLISHNVVREVWLASCAGIPHTHPHLLLLVFRMQVGIFEKQSSAWFQAKAMQTTIVGNLFFNGPRAGINFVRQYRAHEQPFREPRAPVSVCAYACMREQASHSFPASRRTTDLVEAQISQATPSSTSAETAATMDRKNHSAGVFVAPSMAASVPAAAHCDPYPYRMMR